MPTQKSKAIEDLLTAIAGISRQDAADEGVCTACRGPITGFRDDISKREYEISGFCQNCQDDVFGED